MPLSQPRRAATPICAVVLALFVLAGCGGREPREREPLDSAAPAVRTTDLGGAPGAIVVTEDAVWVADGRRGRLLEVDPASGAVRGRPVRAQAPLALAAGDGALWVASGTGAVSRLDAARRRLVDRARVADPGGIAVGAGSVWVTSRRDGTVSALDPRTGALRGRPVRTGTAPADVAVAFGSVWVANTQDGTVSRLDARTRRTTGEPIPVADAQILALAVGEGAVWVAATDSERNTDVELRRIDPQTGEVDEAAVPLPSGVPIDLAAGLGSVWSTDVGSVLPGTPRREPAVRRVDAEAGVPVGRPIPTGGYPAAVATGAGAVWVTSSGDGLLHRIVPARVRRSGAS